MAGLLRVGHGLLDREMQMTAAASSTGTRVTRFSQLSAALAYTICPATGGKRGNAEKCRVFFLFAPGSRALHREKQQASRLIIRRSGICNDGVSGSFLLSLQFTRANWKGPFSFSARARRRVNRLMEQRVRARDYVTVRIILVIGGFHWCERWRSTSRNSSVLRECIYRGSGWVAILFGYCWVSCFGRLLDV